MQLGKQESDKQNIQFQIGNQMHSMQNKMRAGKEEVEVGNLLKQHNDMVNINDGTLNKNGAGQGQNQIPSMGSFNINDAYMKHGMQPLILP